MNEDPYKNIPSLDIEIEKSEETKPKRPSIILAILSLVFIALSFALNLLGEAPVPPEYMDSAAAQAGYLRGRLYSPLIFPFVVVLFLQVFKVCRNNRARVKILFWVSLFSFVGSLGNLMQAAQNVTP